MDIRILGCYGAESPGYRTTCFMINKSLLVDAGAVTSVLTPEEQKGIRNILVTHTHLDHIKDIPLLSDNVVGANPEPVNIISTREVIEILQAHLFNNKLWPDFSKIPTPENPVIAFKEIEIGIPFDVEGLTIKAVEVTHTIPTLAYIIEDGGSSVAILGDTKNTDAVWGEINARENLKAVFIETSFPNNMEELAELSGHLTPAMLATEIGKANGKSIDFHIYHLKPNFLDILKTEISAINEQGNISLLELDETLVF